MEDRIFLDGAVATGTWRRWVGRAFVFLLVYPMCIPPAAAAVLWFVSLGHLNLLNVSVKPFSWWCRQIGIED